MPHEDDSPRRLLSSLAQLPRLVAPTAPLSRVGRADLDPFELPPSTYAGRGRFDAPDGNFRVFYAASSPLAAFGEVLAQHRVSLAAIARVVDTSDTLSTRTQRYEQDQTLSFLGIIPADWLKKRHLGRTTIAPHLRFADIVHPDTLQALRPALASFLTSRQIADLDMAALFSADRAVTQHIANYLHQLHDSDGQPLVAGIRYPSRLHLSWECWALFADRLQHGDVETTTIQHDNPALLEACRVLHLEIAAAG